MQEKLLGMYIMMQLKMAGLIEDLKKEENGASDIVSIIMVIIVVISVAAVFRERLAGVIGDVFTKVNEFITNAPSDI